MGSKIKGWGVRAQGSGLRPEGSGFRAWGVGLRVHLRPTRISAKERKRKIKSWVPEGQQGSQSLSQSLSKTVSQQDSQSIRQSVSGPASRLANCPFFIRGTLPHGRLRTFHRKSTSCLAMDFRVLCCANLVTSPPNLVVQKPS